jgi:hypothetical protein
VICGRNARRPSQGAIGAAGQVKSQVKDDWNPALAEPEVPLHDRHYALSAMCGLVDDFHDRLAEDIFDRLMSYLREIRYTLLRQRLVAEHSYAAAGQCFLRLIEDRKRHFLVP